MMNDLNCQIGDERSPPEIKVSPLGSPLCGDNQVFNNDPSSIKRKCPTAPNKKRIPTVRFEIVVDFVPPDSSEKSIGLHKCYRSEIEDWSKRSDCDEVAKYNTNECVNSKGRGTKCFQKTGDELSNCCQGHVSAAMARGDV